MKQDDLNAIIRDADAGIRAAKRVLEKAPQISRDYLFFWTAYIELATERPASMGGQMPIPLSAIRAYADDLGMDEREYDELKTVIRAVDSRHCRLLNEKAEKASKARG